jgi:hypothetical protein
MKISTKTGLFRYSWIDELGTQQSGEVITVANNHLLVVRRDVDGQLVNVKAVNQSY